MSQETAIFIGRFQPFHNGHLSVIKQMESDEDVKRILIGIGSSEASLEMINPFNLREREGMVSDSLKDLTKPFEVFGIPDRGNDQRWMRAVTDAADEKFGVVYTNNPHVEKLFREFGKAIKNPGINYGYCATDVREMMKKNGEWQDCVPEGSIKKIVEIRGVERLRSDFYKYPKPDVTADVILDCGYGVALVKRLYEPYAGQWAILGGFFDVDEKETVPQTATRELHEEGSLTRVITYDDWFGQYSKDGRDPRGPNIANVFHIQTRIEDLKAGDDAKEIRVFPWSEVSKMDLAFDHNEILEDYIKKYVRGSLC